MELNKKKDSFTDVLVSIGFFLFIILEIFLVQWALFAGGGAEKEENLFVFLISTNIGIIGIIGIFLLKLAQYLIRFTNNYKQFGYLGSVVHDIEDSDLPINNPFLSWLKNPFIFIFIFFILSSIIGLFQVYQNTFFTALPERVPQQITETVEGILSTIPSDLEIYIPICIVGFLLTLTIWMVKTKRLDKGISYLIIYLGLPLVYGLSWMGVHKFHHGNSDLALSYVFMFGIVSAYLFIIFRSIIPVLLLKITGNLYQYLNGAIQSDENILLITIVINLVVFLIFIGIFTAIKSIKKKGEAHEQ